MCGGGTLPFLATASIKENCPCVSSPVARKVIKEPLYQTECSRDWRPRLNAIDSVGFMFAAPGAVPGELISRSMICCDIYLSPLVKFVIITAALATARYLNGRSAGTPGFRSNSYRLSGVLIDAKCLHRADKVDVG